MSLRSLLFFFVSLGAAMCSAQGSDEPATVIVVAGAAGEQTFDTDLKQQVEAWTKATGLAKARLISIGSSATESATADRDQLKVALESEARETRAELWLVFLGHGTFDGKEAKLNLRGPDVSSAEIGQWLKPFKRPLAIIDTTSSSAPFMARLAAPGRVIVTSTRSGNEHNYARFGKFLAEALPDPKSDLDKDGQISLLESFLSASHRTNEFYKTEGRLATEHALIDDNGDGLGTPADWFRGVHATKKSRDGAVADGTRAHQFHLVRSVAELQLSGELRARRDKLELRLAEMRSNKAKISEVEYYKELEKLLLELAELYEKST